MKKELINYFRSLEFEKQKKLVDQLIANLSNKNSINSVISIKENQLTKSGIKCPYCESSSIVGYGIQNNRKRYKCKSCKRTFSSITGTAVHRIHKKSLLNEYVFHMLSGLSLRKIAEELGICLKTAFDWRHKILNAINNGFPHKIDGLIEADETFFLNSRKGDKFLNRKPRKRGGSASKKGINKDHITVMTVYERKSGSFKNTVVCRGRLTKMAIAKGVGKWLDKKNSILCSDSHLSMQAYAKDNNIQLKTIFVRRKEYVFQKIYHIQNVNRLHRELKEWVKKFNGVATKYLQNYLNYFQLVQMVKYENDTTKHALYKIVEYNNTYMQRNNISQLNCIT